MKNKHFTFQDRVLIEDLLNRGNANLTTIAKSFGKDVSTISKEIKKHLLFTNKSNESRLIKQCVKKFTCKISNLGCSNCKHKPGYLCSHCGNCELVCKEKDLVCPKLKRPPYVCNGCEKTNKCIFEKRFYRAKSAQNEYEDTLSISRSITALHKPYTYDLDAIVSPALVKGQSIHHIFVANNEDINVSEKTLYNMVHQELLSASLLDLPRTAQRRIPKQYKYKNPKNKAVIEGRTYMDFCAYSKDFPHEVLQLDTVIGNPSGNALLTMEFTQSKLFLAFLIKEKTMACVSQIFYNIRETLKNINLSQADIMPIILTDNGPEFNDPCSIECDDQGELLSKVFYCNPNAPFQKGNLENNHTNLRRIFPKGTSFNDFTQDDINLAVSHINGFIRSSCMDKSSYDMFCYLHSNGKAFLDAFNIQYIDPKNVTLKPSLLKRK